MRRIRSRHAVLAACFCSCLSVAQTLRPRSPAGAQQNNDAATSQKLAENAEAAPVAMPMGVAAGTPIKVALDSEVRIRSVGQAIHGKTVEPVYAFDKLLIPVGTVVNGKLAAIDGVPGKTRVLDATDGNFSPAWAVGRVGAGRREACCDEDCNVAGAGGSFAVCLGK